MAPRVRYPPPDLRESYTDTYGKQRITRASVFDDEDRRRAFEQRLINRHHIVSRYDEDGYYTTWGDPNAVLGFAESLAYFEDDTEADSKWEIDDILGSGGFGVVGLWIKKDAAGFEVDVRTVRRLQAMSPLTLGRKLPSKRPRFLSAISYNSIRRCAAFPKRL